MSKATTYTLSLIQKAKEVALNNKILKRQEDKQQLDEALEYVYKHLDEWYAKHIDDMTRNKHMKPLYFALQTCVMIICDIWEKISGINTLYTNSEY